MSNNLNCSNCVVNFHKILRNWLGDIEDCSAFMDQIQFLFLLCVCSISNSSLSKAPTLYLHGMVGGIFYILFSIPLFPSTLLFVPFIIKLLSLNSPISWAACFLFALQHTKSFRKYVPASNPFYYLLMHQ